MEAGDDAFRGKYNELKVIPNVFTDYYSSCKSNQGAYSLPSFKFAITLNHESL